LKKKNRKLPDSVVFNQETGVFDAFLKPYPTSLSSPSFQIDDIDKFKGGAVSKAAKKFNKRAEEIKEQIRDLYSEYSDNQMIWSSKISFEPYIGIEIYLYVGNKEKTFASIISPEEWGNKFECLGRFKLDTDYSWKRI